MERETSPILSAGPSSFAPSFTRKWCCTKKWFSKVLWSDSFFGLTCIRLDEENRQHTTSLHCVLGTTVSGWENSFLMAYQHIRSYSGATVNDARAVAVHSIAKFLAFVAVLWCCERSSILHLQKRRSIIARRKVHLWAIWLVTVVFFLTVCHMIVLGYICKSGMHYTKPTISLKRSSLEPKLLSECEWVVS